MPRRKTPSFWIYNEYRNEVLKSIFYQNLPVYMTRVLYKGDSYIWFAFDGENLLMNGEYTFKKR